MAGHPDQMIMPAAPITTQPISSKIIVRNMLVEDADFAGHMTVDAFESKFKWAVGKNNMAGIKRATADGIRTSSKEFQRAFVACYEGKQAGVVFLKFHGDQADFGITDNLTDYISCCGACGLMCMACALGNSSVPQGRCYIDHICVDSSFRGKGIGKILMDVSENEARRRGCNTIYLYVARENRAKNLYERQGFRVTKEEDGCCITWCAVGMRYFYEMAKPLY